MRYFCSESLTKSREKCLRTILFFVKSQDVVTLWWPRILAMFFILAQNNFWIEFNLYQRCTLKLIYGSPFRLFKIYHLFFFTVSFKFRIHKIVFNISLKFRIHQICFNPFMKLTIHRIYFHRFINLRIHQI